MQILERGKTKFNHISLLARAVSNPIPSIMDSLQWQSTDYSVKLKNGLIFDLQAHRGDWFTLLEGAIRQDYLTNGIDLSRGATVIDVGANFGAFALTASRIVGPSGRIFCFEPNPVIFQRLQNNIRKNELSNILAFNEAVGGRDGSIELYVHAKSAFSTTQKEVDGRSNAGIAPIFAPMRSMASIIKSCDSAIDLLKIDCEGAEYDILESLTNREMAPVNQISMEVHRVPGRSVDTISQLLSGLNFEVYPTSPLTAFRHPRGRQIP